jgi:hypothetical protein
MRVEKDGQSIASIEDWRTLAPPKRGDQWVEGRSACELARAWCGTGRPAMPDVLHALLQTRLETTNLLVNLAHPEHGIVFDDCGGEPRNADLAFVGEGSSGRVAVTIEAKADEPFGETVGEALAAALERAAKNPRSRGVDRIVGLARALFGGQKDARPPIVALRHQLLTGLAGTLAYAAETQSTLAVFVVHEFVTNQTSDDKHAANAADLNLFLRRLSPDAGIPLETGRLLGPLVVPGGSLVPTNIGVLIGKVVTDVRSNPSSRGAA